MTEYPAHPVDLGWYRCEEQGEGVCVKVRSSRCRSP